MLIATAAGWTATLLICAAHLRVRRRLVLVARASHELRGPLCAAQLGLHGLAGEPGRLAAIDLELRRAGRALDDLAAAPSGGRARDTRELVDLRALALAYAPSWRTLAAAHGAGFRLEDPAADPPSADQRDADDGSATVFGDPLRIAQACANLVANAAEHGGGVVWVRVRAGGRTVKLEVADDGAGLPAPVPAMIAAARSRQGRRGHGLAVAAAIAEHHGGRLAAAPARSGARLAIELPAAAPSARPRTRRRTESPPPIVA